MAQRVLPLYSNDIPNAIAGPDEEVILTDGKPKYARVTRPTLKVFLPSKEKANGTAVIICPGGGYSIVAYQHEGEDVAIEFNKLGIAAFVLKYRLPSGRTMVNKVIGPLQDAQQAIKMVRQHAKQWNLNPHQIGILGFSAGGHLASTVGTHFNKAVIDNKENVSLKPDFMILIYPVISFTDSLAHLGSRENLIGKNPSEELITSYSNELQVNAQTCPTFIVHAKDDDIVKVENSLVFYEALRKHKVSTEILLFEKGGHGFGLINSTTKDRWFERCKDWMRAHAWLK